MIPEADTLLRAEGAWGIYKYVPDDPDGPWVHLCAPICTPRVVTVTEAGSILTGSPAGAFATDRSTDGGRTWERDVLDGTVGLFGSTVVGPPRRGAVFADDGRHARRSLADGAAGTWETLGVLGGYPVTYGEVPPSDALPDGRMLAAVHNGVTFSDDGGATWTPATGASSGRMVAWGFAFVTLESHPYGGYVLAGISEGGRAGASPDDTAVAVYRSDDGGTTWAEGYVFDPGTYGLENVHRVRLAVSPDGSVWAGLFHNTDGQGWKKPGTVARSSDGGATFAPAAEGYEGGGVFAIAVGGDGRVYVGSARGLWRTAQPAVASEGPRGPGVGLDVSVRPNPAAGRVAVEVTGAASRPVRVTVLEALGREVAVVWDGPVRAGQHLEASTAGLAPGAYVVRAASGAAVASAPLTVAR